MVFAGAIELAGAIESLVPIASAFFLCFFIGLAGAMASFVPMASFAPIESAGAIVLLGAIGFAGAIVSAANAGPATSEVPRTKVASVRNVFMRVTFLFVVGWNVLGLPARVSSFPGTWFSTCRSTLECSDYGAAVRTLDEDRDGESVLSWCDLVGHGLARP